MKNKKELRIKLLLILLVLICFSFCLAFSDETNKFLGISSNTLRKNEISYESLTQSSYSVHYIDVGQGNCTYVSLPDGKNLLIDAGNVMYGETVSKYLQKYNVSQIDYLIATHADSDHIGGFDYIFQNYEIKNIYRPFQICGTGTNASTFVAYEYEDLANVYSEIATSETNNKISRITSEVYKTFIRNIYTETYTEAGVVNDSKVCVFYDGLKISGLNYELEFFAPQIRDGNVDLSSKTTKTMGYATIGFGVSESNDNSSVFILKCFEDKYLFVGDISYKKSQTDTSINHAEQSLIKSLTNSEKERFKTISVYLVSHHGSSYGSGEDLIELVNSKFQVISVGENNSYGHPANDTLSRLQNMVGLEDDYLLRTDEFGSIIFINTGSLKYILENSTKSASLEISGVMLCSIIFVVITIIIISIKPPQKRKKFDRK